MTRKKALEMTRFNYNVSCEVQSRSIINSIYDDIESERCENCLHGGASTMGYTRCLNDDINHLFENNKSMPDDFSCQRWAKS